MTDEIRLETPADAESLYYARQDEVAELRYRPHFTGDIIRLGPDRRVCILQHPCAIRRGTTLLNRILVGDVVAGASAPQDWSTGHFKKMFLPDLDDSNAGVDFTRMDVLDSSEVLAGAREAILSIEGVDLLLQRWIYHNSRVVIPTLSFHRQIAGPFEEADLFLEMTETLVAAGKSQEQAELAIDEWLSADYAPGHPPRRQMLGDPQSVSSIRKRLRQDAASGGLGTDQVGGA
ncbi:hypothetical protein [Agromyces neolithicus]|uniref:Uncharacterized protein n=1 Tax=Agromyces neolithicus TaxID=269420 RepID=A0ABN2M0T5_9MICO